MEFLNKGYAYAKGLHIYRKGIRCVDEFRIVYQKKILTWERAQEKFSLMNTKLGEWEELTSNISG